MKNIFKYMLIATVAVSLISCEDFLDVQSPSTQDAATVFANYTLAEQEVFSIHTCFSATNSYRGRFLPWYGFNTDIEWYNAGGDDAKTQLVAYNPNVNDDQMNGSSSSNPFSDIYSGIERANLAIEGMDSFADLEHDADLAALYAEVLTLRAMFYYDLTKAWGDVPARFEPITSTTIYKPKASRDEIFKQILSDLKKAIPMLPYPNAGSTDIGQLSSYSAKSVDRVNKCFAEGLYARIALQAAGFALRPDDGQVGTGDLGTVRRTNDPELDAAVLYPKALEYLKDAITSGTCHLIPDYKTLWYNVNNFDLNAGNELLFCIPFGGNANNKDLRGRWNYTFAMRVENSTILGNTHTKAGGTAGPTPNFWFKYDSKDVRRDVTCANWFWSEGAPAVAGINTWYFGKFRFDWMVARPFTAGANDDGIKPVVMRYADILLMAAEIENELNGPTTDAKNWLLEVRSRAFRGNESAAVDYVNSLGGKEAFFNAIVDERAFEFCGEFLRKADLIRWNKLGKALEAEKADLIALASLSGDYAALSGNIWWKVNEAGDGVDIYGLQDGEVAAPAGDGWKAVDGYISPSKLKDEKIGYLYLKDPDSRQFWPIFDYVVTNSQDIIVNDYGY
ncbi:MAG: RagB/SusD family nutrient uptake outer membrane protein [Bacteroidales bacterium]|nr:RagB/SusD family nutrient uptake outer membrane protein [Bacteroidales bacterium]